MAQLALTFLTLRRLWRILSQVYVSNLWIQLVHSKSPIPLFYISDFMRIV